MPPPPALGLLQQLSEPPHDGGCAQAERQLAAEPQAWQGWRRGTGQACPQPRGSRSCCCCPREPLYSEGVAVLQQRAVGPALLPDLAGAPAQPAAHMSPGHGRTPAGMPHRSRSSWGAPSTAAHRERHAAPAAGQCQRTRPDGGPTQVCELGRHWAGAVAASWAPCALAESRWTTESGKSARQASSIARRARVEPSVRAGRCKAPAARCW